MPEQFISEAIQPIAATFDSARMATGEPGLPSEFVWRQRTFTVAKMVRTWRETGKCRNGSLERYVRKHWYEVATTSGETLKIYFERQARGKALTKRWWLYSLRETA